MEVEVEAYLHKSRLFRRLRSGPYGPLVERYAACLIEMKLVRLGTRRCLNVVGGLPSWLSCRRCALRHSAAMELLQAGVDSS
jgi:hypothetical protein